MGRKIFVSYKFSDSLVQNLSNVENSTPRDYVNELEGLFENDDNIYKGERADEDISDLRLETIQERLKGRIHDSTITIVLISKGMKREELPEKKQWIPWEVSYSLKELERGGGKSLTNAILGVVLPDEDSDYSYFMSYNPYCDSTFYRTSFLFPILADNMFNKKNADTYDCRGATIYKGSPSYFFCVSWGYFKQNRKNCIEKVKSHYDHKDKYSIKKELENQL